MTQSIATTAARTATAALLFLLLASGCSGLSKVDPDLYPAPPRDAITFWGHACSYIDVGGWGIVTDPVFEENVVNRNRKIGAPPPSAYDNARVVIISHGHPDHLSPRSLETFPRDTVILCPESCEKYIDDVGREVRTMRIGDVYEFPGGRIIAVAAHHMGGRWGVRGDADGRALGYIIETPTLTLYYSGDTNYFDGFAAVGEKYRPDIAIINVNGHLHSNDAVHAAWDTRARVIIPMHFGAYGYFFMSTSDKPRDYDEMEKLLGDQLTILGVGETFYLDDVARETRALP